MTPQPEVTFLVPGEVPGNRQEVSPTLDSLQSLSAESFYCWPSLSAAFGDLLLELRELLLNVGREVAHLE
jgi:hypothetical protein